MMDDTMKGLRKPGKVSPPKAVKAGSSDEKSKPLPPQIPDDDLYETGDICAPERDRDDES